MDIDRFGPDDAETVRAYVEVWNAVRRADLPWADPLTERRAEDRLR